MFRLYHRCHGCLRTGLAVFFRPQKGLETTFVFAEKNAKNAPKIVFFQPWGGVKNDEKLSKNRFSEKCSDFITDIMGVCGQAYRSCFVLKKVWRPTVFSQKKREKSPKFELFQPFGGGKNSKKSNFGQFFTIFYPLQKAEKTRFLDFFFVFFLRKHSWSPNLFWDEKIPVSLSSNTHDISDKV